MRKRPNDVEKLDRISSAMDADKQGNITAGKDVKVDGKLKLTSLVSASNPDGDITKELGGGGGGGGEGKPLYRHYVKITSSDKLYVVAEIFNNSNIEFNYSSFMSYIDTGAKEITCSGCIKISGGPWLNALSLSSQFNTPQIRCYDLSFSSPEAYYLMQEIYQSI